MSHGTVSNGVSLPAALIATDGGESSDWAGEYICQSVVTSSMTLVPWMNCEKMTSSASRRSFLPRHTDTLPCFGIATFSQPPPPPEGVGTASPR
jgi:hypothetical protein